MTDPDTRVCPRCGDEAGDQRFCSGCGLNLAQQEEIPTRADWEASAHEQAGNQRKQASRSPLGRLLEPTGANRKIDRCPHCGATGFQSGEYACESCNWKDPVLEPWVPSGWYQDPANPKQVRYWKQESASWVGKSRKDVFVAPKRIPTTPPSSPLSRGRFGPQEVSTSGVAVASFLCSLIGLWIAGIPLGFHAVRQIDKSEGRNTGRGFAVAGIVLGFIGVIATIIVIIVLVKHEKECLFRNEAGECTAYQ